jgi:hypothetical protein
MRGAIALAALVSLVGCDGKTSGGDTTCRARQPYKVAPVTDGASIRVTVSYGGEAPKPAPIAVTADVEHCGGKVFDQQLIVEATSGGLKNVVVRLVDVAMGKELPTEVSVRNVGCVFEPHVAVTVKGALLKARNEDPIKHSTHPRYENVEFFNWPFESASAEEPDLFGGKKIERLGLITVKCDVHSWMRAYVWVHDNPYIVVTDAGGRATIEEIPAGAYRFVAWHENLGEQEGQVTVKAGEATELKLIFQPEASPR